MITERDLEAAYAAFERLREAIETVIVGHERVVRAALIALLCRGNVLLEGVPGLGKTLLVRTVASALGLAFSRIQFTPDLMPADIVGTDIIAEEDGRRRFSFSRGPVFANVVLADEVNRATPKTQSALLEAMEERTVTVGANTYALDEPYVVLATQNPIEMDGTYPLPEAQLDRFFFKLKVTMPSHDEFSTILDRTGGVTPPQVGTVSDGATILRMGRTLRQVPIEDSVQAYLIRMVRASHPEDAASTDEVKRYVRYGASPRAAQAMLIAARAKALLDGRYHVARADIDAVAVPAMRHRIILSFEGQAEGVSPDEIIRDITRKVG